MVQRTVDKSLSTEFGATNGSRSRSAPPKSRPSPEKGKLVNGRGVHLYAKAVDQQVRAEGDRMNAIRADVELAQGKVKKLTKDQQQASIDRLATTQTDKLIKLREKIMEEEQEKLEKTRFVKNRAMVQFMKSVTTGYEKPEERLLRMEEARQEKLEQMRLVKEMKASEEEKQFHKQRKRTMSKDEVSNMIGRLTTPRQRSVSREPSLESLGGSPSKVSVCMTPEQIQESIDRFARLNQEKSRKLEQLKHDIEMQKNDEIESTRTSAQRKLSSAQQKMLMERLTRKDELSEAWLRDQRAQRKEIEDSEILSKPKISAVSQKLAQKRRQSTGVSPFSSPMRVSRQPSTEEIYTPPSSFGRHSSTGRRGESLSARSPSPGMAPQSLMSLPKQELIRRVEDERRSVKHAQQQLTRLRREFDEKLRQERELRVQAEAALAQTLQNRGQTQVVSGADSSAEVEEYRMLLEQERELRQDAEARAELLQEECLKLYKQLDPQLTENGR